MCGSLWASTAAAATTTCPTGSGVKGGSKTQVLGGIGETNSDCSGAKGQSAINATVTILSFIVGFVAVIMVIVSGFKYITSGGDSGKVASAKNTLIYALIGAAIAVLAQFLVHFVINKASG